jgi:hypothetical protein
MLKQILHPILDCTWIFPQVKEQRLSVEGAVRTMGLLSEPQSPTS